MALKSRLLFPIAYAVVTCALQICIPTATAATLTHRFDFEDESGDDSVGGLEGLLVGDVLFSEEAMSGSVSMLLEGDAYVRVEDPIDFGEEFSISLWVFPDSSALGIQNLIGNGQGGWDTDGWKLYYNTWSNPATADGALILETGDGNGVGLPGDAVRTDTDMIVDDEWYHIGTTIDIDNNFTEMYINGELISTVGGLNVEMSTEGPFEIGNMINGWDLHGMMDDVQIYEGLLTEEEMASLFENPGSAIGVGEVSPGDYNEDGSVNAADINLQAAAIQDPNPRLSTYDEDNDGDVDLDDRVILVHGHMNTWLGDSNLSGVFDSSDFVLVFTEGKYESGDAASWEQGDWNGDGLFNSSDLVTAFSYGGYDVGPRAATNAVPEPSSSVLLILGAAVLARGLAAASRQRNNK